MKLLLDTCTFLWIASGSSQLSAQARALFVDPANEVFLSAASAWEIAVKNELGRLPLPSPPARFVPAQRAAHHIAPLPIDEAAALMLEKLPGLHRDPFDRMLVCQAIHESMVLLTPDPAIAAYSVRVEW